MFRRGPALSVHLPLPFTADHQPIPLFNHPPHKLAEPIPAVDALSDRTPSDRGPTGDSDIRVDPHGMNAGRDIQIVHGKICGLPRWMAALFMDGAIHGGRGEI